MSIASKNLYELLGNDPELDPERATPQPPVKTVDKPAARTGKRNAPAEAPARSGAPTTSRAPRDSGNANENSFRDRNVGADKNRSRGAKFDGEGGDYSRESRGGRGRGRGGRGGRGGARGDRHSRTGVADHEKQVGHGWGATDGPAELADETAGEAIAKKDEKEAVAEDANADADAAVEAEPEDKTKSYEQYLAELAEKKLDLGNQNVRKANEGSSAKFPEGKAVARDEDEDFIAGSGGKNKRTRERKEKAFVELDGDRLLQPAPREGNFGGRGRGGRGRGEGRGGRGGEFRGRGRGEGRGEGRGGRGPRGGAQSGPNLNDNKAFPSLGA